MWAVKNKRWEIKIYKRRPVLALDRDDWTGQPPRHGDKALRERGVKISVADYPEPIYHILVRLEPDKPKFIRQVI